MTNAEHIFAWMENDALLHALMKSAVSYPDTGNFTTARAAMAFGAASQAYREMRRGGQDVNDYTAEDVLKAAVLVLQWAGE